MDASQNPICWCGNPNLLPFSPEYSICTKCKTLVLSKPITETISNGSDDKGLYGKSYWFDHQQNDLGLSDILSRSRSDIPERILYWLRAFLKYKLPPGKTLEIGSSHGGFVAMLQWAGFQAAGLELSPWVVDYARRTFQIPVFLGRLEEQSIEPGTLDGIILMDVLEHLPDPLATIQAAQKLLKPDGMIFIQTPCYPTDHTYESMLRENHPFLNMLRPPEHIYLFNQSSVNELFQACGLPVVRFEQAIFNQYDMFLVASSLPLPTNSQEEIDQSLLATPGGRMVLGLLDKDAECKRVMENWAIAETDRAARLEVIQDQASRYDEKSAQYEELKAAAQDLNTGYAELSAKYVDLDAKHVSLSAKYNSLFQVKLTKSAAALGKRIKSFLSRANRP